jgi:hypothetical protein
MEFLSNLERQQGGAGWLIGLETTARQNGQAEVSVRSGRLILKEHGFSGSVTASLHRLCLGFGAPKALFFSQTKPQQLEA